MKFESTTEGRFFRPVWGAMLAVFLGLLLWLATPIGDPWITASFDYQFRFGSRAVTNQVVLVQMDNESYDYFHQPRFDSKNPGDWHPWDRKLHAQLLNKLADDGAALVVMDTFFRGPIEPEGDEALVKALRRQNNVVLMAEQASVVNPRIAGAQPTYPDPMFLDAAKGNTGVAWLDPDVGGIVRKHWPFPSPGPYHSLPWTAALLAGAKLDEDQPRERWLRYYREGTWTSISYRQATNAPTETFRDKIVFIGSQPHTTDPNDPEPDKFRTPFTRWTAMAYGGVNINITAFLNLLNHDWLERPPSWAETLIFIATGILLGGGLCKLRPIPALIVAAAVALAVTLASVSWANLGNYWFPWLIIVGAQVPFAVGWAIFMPAFHRVQETITDASLVSRSPRRAVEKKIPTRLPDVPDYELVNPPFGEGAYGKVWLVRNAIGQWQALKAIYRENFGENSDPYNREFNGIKHYKPVSEKHPGLLRIEFVSQKKAAGYFYYVMELGDALSPGWEQDPEKYRPRDLVSERQKHGGKIPVRECIRIGLALADALDFLHRQKLTHRDIKPQNVIFVNGQPKLADVGLIAEIRPPEETRTYVGTPGYMPPPPESPGTPAADIYALGMMLYVVSTGRTPTHFPELSTTLVAHTGGEEFLPLNTVILKACAPNPKERFASAGEFYSALKALESRLFSPIA